MKLKKVSVVTGTRADYGLLRWLIVELQKQETLQVEIIATGTHFSPEFGETWKQIVADGLVISHEVRILTEDDSDYGVAKQTGTALVEFAQVFDLSKPDLVVLLGDRYEAFAAAAAAFLMRIPVAHIAGGEVTEGALDDSLRHAITKFSNLHFVAAEDYRERVIQLGEDPESVYNFGAIGLDNFEELSLYSEIELSQFLEFEIKKKNFILVTIHPETASDEGVDKYASVLFDALDSFPHKKVVLTGANADSGGRKLNTLLKSYAAQHPERVRFFSSLGQIGYLSAMKFAEVVVGNSSSGILEAPSAGTPTVNIGDRQKGRLRARSVIDVPLNLEALVLGISKALSPEYQEIASMKISPFGSPGVSAQISSVIANAEFNFGPKTFFDN